MIEDFDCGDADLNDFLKNDSVKYFHGKLTVTYLLSVNEKVVGFYSLANDSVKLKGRAKKVLDELGKSQKRYPAIKICRLGVSKEGWNKGVGTFIIKHVIGTGLAMSEIIGCRFLTVDSYNKDPTLKFYENNGFRRLVTETDKPNIPLYLDLQERAKD